MAIKHWRRNGEGTRVIHREIAHRVGVRLGRLGDRVAEESSVASRRRLDVDATDRAALVLAEPLVNAGDVEEMHTWKATGNKNKISKILPQNKPADMFCNSASCRLN